MSRVTLNKDESSFLAILRQDTEKTAAELDPSLRGLLGASESPEDLDALETDAANARSPSSPPQQEVGEASQTDEELPPSQRELEAGEAGEELAPAPPAVPSRATAGKLFSRKDAHPLAMKAVLDAKYGADWLDWESDTLWWAIRRDFGAVGELNRNKIDAMRVAMETASPWHDFDVFEKCGNAWNGVMPIFGAYQPMNPSQAAFTVSVLRGLHPEAEFGHEVAAYLGAVLDEAGWVYAPEEWFPGAQDLLNRKDWLTNFTAHVGETWSSLENTAINGIEWRNTNPLDVHIAKLMAVREYLAEMEDDAS